MRIMDTDGNGSVDYKEFSTAFRLGFEKFQAESGEWSAEKEYERLRNEVADRRLNVKQLYQKVAKCTEKECKRTPISTRAMKKLLKKIDTTERLTPEQLDLLVAHAESGRVRKDERGGERGRNGCKKWVCNDGVEKRRLIFFFQKATENCDFVM
jgi:hypothetical protein